MRSHSGTSSVVLSSGVPSSHDASSHVASSGVSSSRVPTSHEASCGVLSSGVASSGVPSSSVASSGVPSSSDLSATFYLDESVDPQEGRDMRVQIGQKRKVELEKEQNR